ncbi:hypothetical protein HQ447_07525, partial [bacterium]|nr:hypothetical protein [bacterium]
EGRVLVPVWAKDFGEGSVFGTGVSSGLTAMDVDGALGLQQQDLQTLQLQATFAHFPTAREGWMGLAIVSAGLATDFNEIDGDDFALSTVLVGGYQFNPRFTLAAAVAYFHSVGDDTVVPGLGVIWQPNDQWIVQLTPPIVGVGWSPDPGWTFSVSAYPGGGAWDVDQEGTNSQVEAIKLEGWRAGLGVERRLGEHWRVNAQVGMNFGGELDLHDSGGDTLFKRDLDPSLFGLLGVAWTF